MYKTSPLKYTVFIYNSTLNTSHKTYLPSGEEIEVPIQRSFGENTHKDRGQNVNSLQCIDISIFK